MSHPIARFVAEPFIHRGSTVVKTHEAAKRWADTWAAAWPAQNTEALCALQAENGDHYASMFRRYEGREGLRTYLTECFNEETAPSRVWFGDPRVDGDTATVEYWAHITTGDGPLTISGCTVITFNEHGLVACARDYSHATEGHPQRPDVVA